MNLRLFFLFCLFSFSLISCGPDYLFDKQIEVPNGEWTYENIPSFEVDITDTLQIYNLYLDIEHSVDYSKQNIYILIHTEFPSGEKISERVPIDFAEKSGKWYGDCGKEWCDLQVTIQEGAFFNALGKHTFRIEQYMRINPLPGIKAIGFKVEKTEMRMS